MKFLLDTHILLRSLQEPEALEGERLRMLRDRANVVLVSSVSVAEIAIKCSLGKLRVEGDLIPAIQDSGFEWLDFCAEEAIALKTSRSTTRIPLTGCSWRSA